MLKEMNDHGSRVLSNYKESAPFAGQVSPGTYYSQNEYGTEVTVITERSGDIFEDPSIKCAVLEYRPKMVGRSNQTRLRLTFSSIVSGQELLEDTTYIFSGNSIYRLNTESDSGSKRIGLRLIDVSDAVRITTVLRGITNTNPNTRRLGG